MNNAVRIIEKQVLRGLVLGISNQAEPLGAGVDIIQSTLKQHGYNLIKDEILTACNYLQGKGLVRMEHVENEVLKLSRDIAHITPKGVDVLEGTEKIDGIELGG